VPESQHLQVATVNSVVNEIANPAEVEPANAGCSAAKVPGANARLLGQKHHGFSKVHANGQRRSLPIGLPPFSGLADLPCCSRSDLDPQAHAQ
jgi:hypothetical protein